jgi:hypothetical protein
MTPAAVAPANSIAVALHGWSRPYALAIAARLGDRKRQQSDDDADEGLPLGVSG